MTTDLVLTHVAERDVDLLLVEEFCCSSEFFNWFTKHLRPHINDSLLEFVQARHSVSSSGDGSGETDIEVIAELKSTDESCRLAVLIENKIGANFTQQQPERYVRRAKELVRKGLCSRSIIVLLAPADYAGQRVDEFDVRISYEQVIEHFRSRESELDGELMHRCQHRRAVLEQALYGFRRGYVASPVAEVTNFWLEYWKMCLDVAPALQMARPKPKPGDSYSVPFPCLDSILGVPRASLYHVMRKGTVDLLFAASADHLTDIGRKLAQYFDPDMKPRRASKSLAVTIHVPPLDTFRPLAEQAATARKAVDAALRLRNWYQKHTAILAEAFQLTNAASTTSHLG